MGDTNISRRNFLKLSIGTGLVVSTWGLPKLTKAEVLPEGANPDYLAGKKIPTVCTFCGVGCGIIATVLGGKLVKIEGDPYNPINAGRLCPKGLALSQMSDVNGTLNPQRQTKVLYRAPNDDKWQEKSWEWAIAEIARKIKTTRDTNWVEQDGNGNVVNRTEAIASIGSVFPSSEECYLLTKLMRALGIVYMDNESRICVSAGVTALTGTIGRGPMTNHWIDLRNSDCIMIIGSNPAETFVNGFRWMLQAQEKGASIIHVDPRFTRTSARADIYARIRIGTDIAFIGGMINYVLQNDLYNEEYIKEYTDAAFLVNSNYEFNDGLFSGYDAASKSYDTSTWAYQRDENGIPKMDMSLQDPNCVFQLMKTHFSQYDVDTVCNITGTQKDTYLKICQTFGATGQPGKAGAFVCSSGATQHSQGTQYVRCYAILQLLLGNIGLAGGGINGIAGAANGLGCSLQGRLFHVLPGNIPMPSATDGNLTNYLDRITAPVPTMEKVASPWRSNPKYLISLLKAWYGEAATAANDFGWGYLPKLSGNYSWIPLFEAMNTGTIKGLICWGMNPAVSGPNSMFTRDALGKLDWMVIADLWETETSDIWKRPGMDPASCKTEIFLLPAAAPLEKEGSVTSSARWMQWRYKALDPPDQAQPDLWMINKLYLKLKSLYTQEGGPNAEAITVLNWDYGDIPDVHAVAKEINGYDLTTGKLISGFSQFKDDGTTSAGNWIFCGSYTEEGNQAARRDTHEDPFGIGLYPNWAWAFPANRRIMYNRASVKLDGEPWDPEHPVIQWDSITAKWIGDVPDGGPPPGAIYPFVMRPEGRANLFSMPRVDGPFPEHYEPWESPVKNPMSSVQSNPVLKSWESEKGVSENYPIIATTFRLVEHMHTGTSTRNLPWLVEAMPAMFVELSEELALEKNIQSGAPVIIESVRGEIHAVAIVTKRLRPLDVNGTKVHQIGLPWNWGYIGKLSNGGSANVLTSRVADPNSLIPEYRAFLCNVRKI